MNAIIQHINKDNLLNFEEIEKLHISIEETILRSFDEFLRSYKSTESFKDLLIKNLNEESNKLSFINNYSSDLTTRLF